MTADDDHLVASHRSPDCAAGKCGSCTGDGWCAINDEMVPCSHVCHIRPAEALP